MKKQLFSLSIFFNTEEYGITRDELYFKMIEQNVFGRRYFYPLVSEFSKYRGLSSSASENLPNAHKMANSVLCLPMHHAQTDLDLNRILDIVVNKR